MPGFETSLSACAAASPCYVARFIASTSLRPGCQLPNMLCMDLDGFTVMHTVRLVVYANFQPLALAVAAVFEYANLSYGRAVYDFKIVSENPGSVLSSQG